MPVALLFLWLPVVLIAAFMLYLIRTYIRERDAPYVDGATLPVTIPLDRAAAELRAAAGGDGDWFDRELIRWCDRKNAHHHVPPIGSGSPPHDA